jgi:tryptophan-rich sensory protein
MKQTDRVNRDIIDKTALRALESFLYLLASTVGFLIYKNNKSRYKTALSIQFAKSIANNRSWQPLILKLPDFSTNTAFM